MAGPRHCSGERPFVYEATGASVKAVLKQLAKAPGLDEEDWSPGWVQLSVTWDDRDERWLGLLVCSD